MAAGEAPQMSPMPTANWQPHLSLGITGHRETNVEFAANTAAVTAALSDLLDQIDEVLVEGEAGYRTAKDFMRMIMPSHAKLVKRYDEQMPLFARFQVESYLGGMFNPTVQLKSGGYIVIGVTEALVAIDVNSGNFRVENDAERTAYEMNLRAAKEIARQLRLRDLGGVICNDFIDMRDEKHRRGVEKALRDAIKRDRARTKILRMSQFGVIEMTRQRIRPSLKRSVYEDCPECSGAGVVKTVESMSIDVMRLLALAAHREDIRRVNITVNHDVATYLNNRKRKEIARFESEGNVMVYIHPEANAPREHLQLDCFDAQNGEVRLLPAPPPPPRRSR
jgi:ribonuclease E